MTAFDKCGLQKVKKLGEGTYSIVYAVKDKNGELKALKLNNTDQSQMEESGITEISEVDVLARLRHPNLMYTDRVITSLDCEIGGFGIILPLGASSLVDQIKLPSYSDEEKIRHIFEIIDGIAYLHSQGVLHLDLKPQNIIIDKVPNGKAIVADFGLAAYIDGPNGEITSYRESITISYRAPELLTNPPWIFKASADIWSIGIIILGIFYGKSYIYSTILKSKYDFVDWDDITDVASMYKDMFSTRREATFKELLAKVPDKYRPSIMDLVDRCLKIDPKQRPSAAELLQLPMFSCLQPSQGGLTLIPNLPPKTDPIVRETVKYISLLGKKVYPDKSIRVLFLAYDIAYRAIGPFLTEKVGSLTLAVVAMWMASKLIHNYRQDESSRVSNRCRGLFGDSCIEGKDYYKSELMIIHELKGCLYRNYLYHAAQDMIQLTQTYQYIVLDPTVYYVVDIPKWFEINKPVPNATPKGLVKISEFFK